MAELIKLETKTLFLRKRIGCKCCRETFASIIALPAPAAEVIELEVVEGKVIAEAGGNCVQVRGEMVAEIYFRDQDGLWRREEEVFPFRQAVEFGGVKPGDPVRASCSFTGLESSLEEEGHAVRLEAVLELLVEAWTVERTHVAVEAIGPPELKLNRTRVIVENYAGEGVAQKTVERLIDLPEEVVQVFRLAVSPRGFAALPGEGEVLLRGTAAVQLLYVNSEHDLQQLALEAPVELAVALPEAAPWHRAYFWVSTYPAEYRLSEIPGNTLALRVVLEGRAGVVDPVSLELLTGASAPNLRVHKSAFGADRYLGTAEAREEVFFSTRLSKAAARLLQAEAVLKRVTGTALAGKATVSGMLVQKLFCLDEGGGLLFHREEIPFTAAVPLEGCRSGAAVDASVRLGRLSAALVEAGRVEQTAVVEIAVRASERVELDLVTALAVMEPPPVPARVYLAQPGDTLPLIARRFRVCLEELHSANPTVEDPGSIFPGDRIFIPRR